MSRKVQVDEYLTQDKSSRHVHARLFHRGGFYVREECQTDQSGAWNEIHDLAGVKLTDLCRHEWKASDPASVLEATAAVDDTVTPDSDSLLELALAYAPGLDAELNGWRLETLRTQVIRFLRAAASTTDGTDPHELVTEDDEIVVLPNKQPGVQEG